MNKLLLNVINEKNLAQTYIELSEILINYGHTMEACFTLESAIRLSDEEKRKELDKKVIDINIKTSCKTSYQHFSMLQNEVAHEFAIEFTKKRDKSLVTLFDRYMACLHLVMLMDSSEEELKQVSKIKVRLEKALKNSVNEELVNHINSVKKYAEENTSS